MREWLRDNIWGLLLIGGMFAVWTGEFWMVQSVHWWKFHVGAFFGPGYIVIAMGAHLILRDSALTRDSLRRAYDEGFTDYRD